MWQQLTERHLALAGWVFAAGSALHLADHLRRGQGSITDTLYVAGNLALILQVTVIVLTVTRHRLAPRVAAAAGPALALGFVAAHWLPEWSELSDPFVSGDAEVLSMLASGAEIAGALLVGAVGWGLVTAGRNLTARQE